MILVILTATSNNFSIRKLGGRNWKRLHRLAYVAAALLIYHQSIAGKLAYRALVVVSVSRFANCARHEIVSHEAGFRSMFNGS